MQKMHTDLLTGLTLAQIPDIHWLYGDNLCDCVFQRIGDWTNPYLGRTLRVRLCCIWAEIYKAYPQHVQEIPAYYDENTNTYETEPRAWDSEDADMPVALWLRQMAVQTGRSVEELRVEYADRLHERPKKVTKGEGWQSRNIPSHAVVGAAREAQLRAAGWLLEGQKIPDEWQTERTQPQGKP